MSNRCPSCSKMASLDTEVEADDLDISDGVITGTVRVVRKSGCCGDEIKEYNFDVEEQIDGAEKHDGGKHELSIEVGDAEPTESGGGRYAKNMIRFELTYTVNCACRKKPIAEGSISDEVAASWFDDLN